MTTAPPRKRRPRGQSPLIGGGELGALVRSTDWSTSTLGPLETWPRSLLTTLGTCLASRLPMVVAWGPELSMFYNDAYRQVVGPRHPWALGRPTKEIWPEVWEHFAPITQSVLTSGEGVLAEDVPLVLHRYGFPEPCHFTFSISPVWDDDGTIRGVCGVVNETTARVTRDRALQAAHREAERNNQRKDEFLAMLGHELRTPLAALSTALAMRDRCDRRGGSHGRAEELQAGCQRQLRALVRLVDDLLDISRITRGVTRLEQQPLELEAVVRSALSAMRPSIAARGHQLTIAIEPGLCALTGDPARLEQVFCNLLGNAAKFTPVGGQISLSMANEGGWATIRVKDNGPGLAPSMLEEVFLPFVQADKALDRRNAGLGIGLTVARGVAELHGGTVTAASDGPGLGTEVIVRLPLEVPAPIAPAPSARPQAQPVKHRVLVVEDNDDIREVMRELLQDLGHEVAVALTGPEAVEKFTEYQPDVALIDIGLPGFDGYEVARQIRLRAGSKGHLVALSGYGGLQAEVLALQAGFNRHVAKPVDTDHFDELLAHD